MSKLILVKVKRPPQELFAKAQQEAIKQGYKLIGDATKGVISGSGVSGNYKLNGNNVFIMTIHDKPALLSWKTIEQKLTSFLTE